MQIFIYTNLRGQSVTFGGGPPYVFEKIKGMGGADLDIADSTGAYQQGHTIHRLQREERRLTLHFHVDGRPGMDTVYKYRQNLLGVLSPRYALDEDTGEYARLTYTNDYGSWWTWAVPEGARYEKRLSRFMVSCPVTFHCPSPFWFPVAQDTTLLEISIDSFSLPFSLPFRLGTRRFSGAVHNTGHVDAPVIIEISGVGERPILLNRTTGAKLSVALPIAGGELLRINTDPEHLAVELYKSNGTVVNAYGYLSLDSALSEFVLRPGLNKLEYRPTEPPSRYSKVRVLWYPRLEGV